MPVTKPATASCPECEIEPFTRNHYFTGKLLVERDFRQEQEYYVDKLRLHAQRLHGSGVVCGLKVVQHDNPACRDRFVCVQPGFAIDCCGHDILVIEKDCIDLTQLAPIQALKKKNDTVTHTLQVRICYKECPTEPIPVLYDDCGCDDTQCAPNRILESYEITVAVDPPSTATSPQSPAFAWQNSINVAHASSVAYHDSTRRLYILTDDPQGFVYQISTDNFSVLSSHALNAHGIALAVSNDGSRVYVAAEGAATTDPNQLHVLDVTQAGLPLVQAQPIDIPNSSPGSVVLEVSPAPDNRLLSMTTLQGALLRWGTDIDTQANPAAPTSLVQFGANQESFALSTDGSKAYSGGSGNQIQAFVLAASSTTTISVLPAGANVTDLEVAQSATGDLVVVIDQTSSKLYLVNPATPALVGTVALGHPPTGLVISPDSHWAYIVEQDAGKSYLEAVDLLAMQAGSTVTPVGALELGNDSQTPAITTSGNTLFVPYTGDLATPTDGGVAIVEITASQCCSIIWDSLDGCPSCDTADCLVLATIKNWVVGNSFEDQTDPPADPAADQTDHVSRIDNRTGRKMLPSTSTLTEIIQCMCAEGGGAKGPKGDTGPAGQPGTNGTNGTDGQGLEKGLTRIVALSWQHNSVGKILPIKRLNPSLKSTPGIVIAFSQNVHVSGLPVGTNPIDAQHIFQVWVEDDPQRNKELGLFCHCPVTGSVVPVSFTLSGTQLITSAQEVAAGDALGVAFLFDNPVGFRHVETSADVWVKLHCDFVIDLNGKAVDGEFLRMQLPTGDHMGTASTPPAADPFGLQGGLFESWFKLKGQ